MSDTHPYERAGDGDYCAAPDSDSGVCSRQRTHPIHAVDRPEIERLAQALLAHPWRLAQDDLQQGSEHRRHNYSYECALCTKDAHLIAAFFIDHFNAS